MQVAASHSSKLLPSMAPENAAGRWGGWSRPLTPAAMESTPHCPESQSPAQGPISMLQPGFCSNKRCWKRAKCRHNGCQQSGRAQHAYQL